MSAADNLHNPAAEWSIIATLLTDPSFIAEVVGSGLAAEDFLRSDAQALYGVAVERFYGDLTVEPLSVAEAVRPHLAKVWKLRDHEVPDAILAKVKERDYSGSVMDHAAIVKRLSTARKLLGVTQTAMQSLGEGVRTPEEIAGSLSADALAITSGSVQRTELMGWMDTGREYARYLRRLRLAREKGIELAVYTGFPFIDEFTKGIAPTELCFIAGAPGVGKSVLAWRAGEGFAARQMMKPEENRIATLIVSMEMGLVPSSTRLAQSITEVDGMRLREGDITDKEYQTVLREWKARDGLPIYFNYASNFRLSQLRALIVEAIRKYNVGFVVIDHFRQLDPDRYIKDPLVEDEVKARFLKEAIAKDLNVAVLCLGHTIKIGREPGTRPKLSDLRGSGQISANADFVGFMHVPSKGMTEDERLALGVSRSDAELLWEKARHTADGAAYFTFEPATMTVRTR
jgi:replicative DNA helicase